MEQKNIFENAKFGDRFVTRNGELAIFKNMSIGNATLVINHSNCTEEIICSGTSGKHINMSGEPESINDIVGRYIESIDEERLEKLAKETWTNRMKLASANHVIVMWDNFIDGFKAGYRKAMER